MEFISQIIGWILFVISSAGLMHLTSKLFKSGQYTTPAVTISLVAIIVYLGGIIVSLNITVYALLILGVISFILFIKKFKSNKNIVYHLSISSILFWGISFMFFILLLNLELEHYDNFSHWAIVIKDMFITEAIPNASSELIDFKNYPLGVSSFIYYVCKLIGYNEGNMLFAQGLLIYSCIYAIFGIIEEKKRFLLYMVLGTSLSVLAIFNISIRINTLLVDFILPVLTLATIASIYKYRNNIVTGYKAILPMLGLLAIVKSTGIVFALFAVLYLLYETYRYSKDKSNKLKIWLMYIITIIGSGVTSVIWSMHMRLQFGAVSNKFELKLSTLQVGALEKTASEIETIVSSFLRTVLDIRYTSTAGIVLFAIVALVATFIAKKTIKKNWKVGKVAVIGLVMVILYHLGILGMYIFSMPTCEAVELAGLERYVASIVVLYGGIIAICITLDIQDSFEYKIGNESNYKSFKSLRSKGIYNNTVVALGAIIFLLIGSEYNGLMYNSELYADSTPSKIKMLVGDKWNNSEDNNKYIVYSSNDEDQVTNNYVRYAMKYYLYSHQVNVFNNIDDGHTKELFHNLGIEYTDSDIDNIDRLLEYHDILIVLDPLDDNTKEVLSSKYEIDYSNEGIYSIKKIIKSDKV